MLRSKSTTVSFAHSLLWISSRVHDDGNDGRTPGWIGQVDRAASLANRALELTTEPAVRARVRGVLGYALSLTLQHGRTVALMSDLAPELAGTEDMAWAAAGMAASTTR